MACTDENSGEAARTGSTEESAAGQLGDFVDEFVLQVVRTSLMLSGLLGNLTDDLPDDVFPGETTGHVLLEMLTGTIRPVAEQAGEPLVREATRLLDASGEKVIDDLRAALALRVAMDRGAMQG